VAKSYRPVVRDQSFLLPVDMREWLPADHLVWFVLETLDALDTSVFHARSRKGGVGRAGYDPDMVLALTVYGYCRGVRSSRQIERLCHVDVAFRVICAGDVPDHATIARFRVDHADAFEVLFGQVLTVAAVAGLARFGTIAIDGTKIAANASLDANRDGDRLAAEAARIIAEAAAVDAAEDAVHGRGDGDGDGGTRVPAVLKDPRTRAARIAAAAAELAEQQRRAAEAASRQDPATADRLERLAAGQSVSGGRYRRPEDRLAAARLRLDQEKAKYQKVIDAWHARVAETGRRPRGPAPVPVDEYLRVMQAQARVEAAETVVAAAAASERPVPRRAQPKRCARVVNVSDPASRIMKTRKGWVQGYNVQVVATSDQVITALAVTQEPGDVEAFVPMMRAAKTTADRLHAITTNPDHLIGTVLADAGYASDTNLRAGYTDHPHDPGPDRLIALGKSRDAARAARTQPAHGDPPPHADPRQAMDHRLRTPDGAALYKRRGATVEPAIGNLKKILDRFSRRGIHAVTSEAHLAASAFNLLKIYRATLA
jgi:transposase